MKYISKKLENKNVQFEITIDKTEWDKSLEESYNHNKGKYTVEGFRKGKAPRRVIEKNYGDNVFFEDALNHAFFHAYNEILEKETDLEVVDTPKIDIKEVTDNGVVLLAEVTTRPDVTLGKYTGLAVKVENKTLKEEQVETELKNLQERSSRLVELKDGEIKNGHVANIDFSGSVDGKVFEGGTAEGFDLEIGSKSFIDNFEEQLVGLKVGDKKDVKVTFPKEYHAPDLAGKAAVFAVTINSIKEKQLPELNDELIADTTPFKTVEEFKKDVTKKLQQQIDNENKTELENKVIDAVVDNVKVDIPAVMVEQELDAMLQDMENRLMYQGINLEQYAQYLNTTVEQIKEERRPHAEKGVKVKLTLQEIVKKEKMEATEEELTAHIEKLADSMKKSAKEFRKTLSDERIDLMKNEVLVTKLLEFLISNNS